MRLERVVRTHAVSAGVGTRGGTVFANASPTVLSQVMRRHVQIKLPPSPRRCARLDRRRHREPASVFDCLGLRLGSHIQEFSAGPRDYAAVNAADLGVETFDEEYQFRGGTLKLGSTVHYDKVIKLSSPLVVAAWQGQEFSLFTHAYNGVAGDLLDLMSRIELAELDDGIKLVYEPSLKSLVIGVNLLKEFPVLGLLDIRPATRALWQQLPKWDGMTTPGGNLYIDDDKPENITFLLVGDSAVTRIIPDLAADHRQVAEAAASLEIKWQQAD